MAFPYLRFLQLVLWRFLFVLVHLVQLVLLLVEPIAEVVEPLVVLAPLGDGHFQVGQLGVESVRDAVQALVDVSHLPFQRPLAFPAGPITQQSVQLGHLVQAALQLVQGRLQVLKDLAKEEA